MFSSVSKSIPYGICAENRAERRLMNNSEFKEMFERTCTNAMDNMFENTIEFKAGESTALCVKSSGELDFLKAGPVRLVAEDLLAGFTAAAAGEEDAETLAFCFAAAMRGEPQRDSVSFTLKTKEGETLFCGIILVLSDSVRFYFQNAARLNQKITAAKQNLNLPPKRVRVQTFVYFEVFIDDEIVLFQNPKAKELLALLVDRRGGYVTAAEAIKALWGEEKNNSSLARLRKTAMLLRSTLKEHGAENIIESIGGMRRIIPENIDCDFYEFLDNPEKDKSGITDIYLKDYKWSQGTRTYYSSIKAEN